MTDGSAGLRLEPGLCRERQQRLAAVLVQRDLQRAVLVQPEHVQYLTGFRAAHILLKSAVSLDADGHCTLAAPNSAPEDVAADDIVTFEAQWHATLRQEQPRETASVLAAAATPETTTTPTMTQP